MLKTTPVLHLLWVLAVISSLVLGGFFLKNLYVDPSKTTYTDFELNIRESTNLLSVGNFSDAVIKSTAALDLSQTHEERRAAEFLLARSLLGQNDGTDFTNAVTLFKAVANDESTAPERRAGAIISLSRIYYHDTERKIIVENVFSTEPFNEFLYEANYDVDIATISLLELANTLFPTSYAHSEISTIARLRIHKQGIQTGNPEQIQLANKIFTSLNSIELLSPQEAFVNDDQLISRQVSKSFSLGTTYYLLPEKVTNEVVNEAYEKALTMMRENQSYTVNYAMTELSYAASLQSRQPEKMSSRIESLLTEIVTLGTNDLSVRTAFVEARKSNFTAKQLPYLVTRSAEFAQFNALAASGAI